MQSVALRSSVAFAVRAGAVNKNAKRMKIDFQVMCLAAASLRFYDYTINPLERRVTPRMILTCPQCSARFQLAAEVLSPEGRTVRCSACQTSWFEKPDPDELAQNEKTDQQPLEDIPDGVKPVPEGSNVPALAEEPDDGSLARKDRKVLIGGFVAALLFFTMIFSGVLAAKSSIISIWPESYVFYRALGLVDHVPGQGLIFDRLSAKQDNDLYVIEGHVINLTSNQRIVPLMEASLIAKDGTVRESWIIEPPKRLIEKEETMAFRAQYKPGHVDDASVPLDVFFALCY